MALEAWELQGEFVAAQRTEGVYVLLLAEPVQLEDVPLRRRVPVHACTRCHSAEQSPPTSEHQAVGAIVDDCALQACRLRPIAQRETSGVGQPSEFRPQRHHPRLRRDKQERGRVLVLQEPFEVGVGLVLREPSPELHLNERALRVRRVKANKVHSRIFVDLDLGLHPRNRPDVHAAGSYRVAQGIPRRL